MAKAAFVPDLALVFTDHAAETTIQLERPEKLFDGQRYKSPNGTSKVMKAFLVEESDVISEEAKQFFMDMALATVAQRVEYYEMAGYECVSTFTERLGQAEAAGLLQDTLDEEGKGSQNLTTLQLPPKAAVPGRFE